MVDTYESGIRRAHDELLHRFEERIHAVNESVLGQGKIVVVADPEDPRGARTLELLGVQAASAIVVALDHESFERACGTALRDKIELKRLEAGPAGFVVVIFAAGGISVQGWRPGGEGGGPTRRPRKGRKEASSTARATVS